MMNNSPNLNPADLDTLTGTFKHILNKFMQSMDGCLPAKVIQYDRNKNRAQVQPVIALITTSGAQVSKAQIASVPVFRFGGGNFVISFNLKPGDLGWIVANDRDISQFLQTYQESQPNTFRIHNFSDALFFPDKMVGVTISEEDQDNCVIQSLDGSVKISLGETYIKFTAPEFIFDGDVTVTGSLEAQNGLTVSPDAGGNPNVTGNIYVDGTIEATGNITPNVPPP